MYTQHLERSYTPAPQRTRLELLSRQVFGRTQRLAVGAHIARAYTPGTGSFYAKELAMELGMDAGPVNDELKHFESMGIVRHVGMEGNIRRLAATPHLLWEFFDALEREAREEESDD